MAVAGVRQHGGNDGYDDDPAASYAWDSTVPNRENVSVGDYVVLWDKQAVLGASRIDKIEVGQAEKVVHRCPQCGKSGIKARKSLAPRYNCYKCKFTFDEPSDHVEHVTTYRTHHSASWVDLDGLLSGAELRKLCVNPRSQLSLRPFRWAEFRRVVHTRRRDAPLDFIQTVEARIASGHKVRSVRVRVGQGAFRRRLVERYGNTCAFTGPCPDAVIQACHLYSYAEKGVHHEAGGLLLRADLHTLFDRGEIRVEPKTQRLDLDSKLSDFPLYFQLNGRQLFIEPSSGQQRWLRAHWEMHRKTLVTCS